MKGTPMTRFLAAFVCVIALILAFSAGPRAVAAPSPTEKDKARILRKLEVGLDTVMAEDGTAPAPVKAAKNGN